MHVTKRIDLVLLGRELTAAAIPFNALGLAGSDTDGELFTYTTDVPSEPTDLPSEAQPVVDAHRAPPRAIDYAGESPISARATTTDAAPTELLRFPLDPQTGYDVTVRIMGVDRANGAVKKLKADVTMKRLNAGPLQVGATTVTVTHQDAAAAAWALGVSFAGNDAVLSATGAAGRTIDWLLAGDVGRFAPAGLGG